MRAGRLLSILLALQSGRRVTARELSEQLEVSERTILRDLEVLSGSGIPVYAVRGPGGGFQMLDTFNQSVPSNPAAPASSSGRIRRVRVRLSPTALQLAQLTGRPDGWRHRPNATQPDEEADWLEGSFRYTSSDAAIRDLAALGPEVEVLLPTELRSALAEFGSSIARRNRAESQANDSDR